MAEVVLDANVIVGWLDKADVHNARATELIDGLKRDGHVALLFDVFVAEAVSVICRRAQERRSKSTDRRPPPRSCAGGTKLDRLLLSAATSAAASAQSWASSKHRPAR